MALTKEFKYLIALASQGPGPIPQIRMRETMPKRKTNPQHADAVEKARPASEAIFAWLAGPVGEEIRAEMIEAGTKLVPLHGWHVCLTQEPGMLHTRRDPNPAMGAFDNTRIDARTPEELIRAVGPEIVVSIHEDIVHDRLFASMSAHLRHLTSGVVGH